MSSFPSYFPLQSAYLQIQDAYSPLQGRNEPHKLLRYDTLQQTPLFLKKGMISVNRVSYCF